MTQKSLDDDSGKCDSQITTIEKGFRTTCSGAFFFAEFGFSHCVVAMDSVIALPSFFQKLSIKAFKPS